MDDEKVYRSSSSGPSMRNIPKLQLLPFQAALDNLKAIRGYDSGGCAVVTGHFPCPFCEMEKKKKEKE